MYSFFEELPLAWQQTLTQKVVAPEKIHWMGQPQPVGYMKSCWPFYIAALLFTLVTLAGTTTMLNGTMQAHKSLTVPLILFSLFGVISIAGLFSPLWIYKSARNLLYVITDQRLLICNFGRNPVSMENWPGDVLSDIQKTPNANGTADILYGTQMSGYGKQMNGNSSQAIPVFLRQLSNADQAESLLKELRRQALASPRVPHTTITSITTGIL